MKKCFFHLENFKRHFRFDVFLTLEMNFSLISCISHLKKPNFVSINDFFTSKR